MGRRYANFSAEMLLVTRSHSFLRVLLSKVTPTSLSFMRQNKKKSAGPRSSNRAGGRGPGRCRRRANPGRWGRCEKRCCPTRKTNPAQPAQASSSSNASWRHSGPSQCMLHWQWSPWGGYANRQDHCCLRKRASTVLSGSPGPWPLLGPFLIHCWDCFFVWGMWYHTIVSSMVTMKSSMTREWRWTAVISSAQTWTRCCFCSSFRSLGTHLADFFSSPNPHVARRESLRQIKKSPLEC